MNGSTLRQMRLRDLTHHLTQVEDSTTQLETERESVIRLFGLAHPRSIDVSRRLISAQRTHRHLSLLHRQRANELARDHQRQIR